MRKIATFVILLVFTLLFYQNCSEVELTPNIVNQTSKFSAANKVCSIPDIDNFDNIKFVFTVDMSASNALSDPALPNPQGSDPFGKRFQAIKDFIASDCIKDSATIETAINGFAHTDIFPSGGGCDKNQFKDLNNIDTVINDFINYNTEVGEDCGNSKTSGKCASHHTNYEVGVSCAEEIIRDDVQSMPADQDKPFYMSFFLTDGEPIKSNGNPYTLGSSDYRNFKTRVLNEIDNIHSTISNAGALGFSLRPIFYGGAVLSQSAQDLADDILGAMADKGLTDKITLDNVNQLDICDFVNSGFKIPFEFKEFVVTNLNYSKRGAFIEADSDMDGLPDSKELENGFDPQSPRSLLSEGIEILDGSCSSFTKANCASIHSNAISCGPINKLGFNQCDVSALGLTNGLDSNGDGFLDIMRLIKGVAPNGSAFEDGDNLNERQELLRGRDPLFPDDDTSPELLVDYEVRSDSCGEGLSGRSYKINHIPLVETLAVRLSPIDNINILPIYDKGKDENIIMIYYILTPQNTSLKSNFKDQVFAKFIKVDLFGNVLKEYPFEKIGELGDKFIDSNPL